jgi:uncharacterized OB-fold protein
MDEAMRRPGEYVIPREAVPEVMTRVTASREDGASYVERTEPMFTTYWATAGELSPFFLAVMREKKIIGARCPSCGMVICPPYMTRCPSCQNEDRSMVELELGLELPQVGWMLGTPPITVFANARFARYAPFGRGRVVLGESQSALPVQVFTTAGFLRPGIFRRGTEVKIVFRSTRIGFSTDYFAVPLAEVPAELRDKDGLEETELSWQSLELLEPTVTEEGRASLPAALDAVREFVAGIPGSPRARRDLLNWTRRVLVRTGGGDLGLVIGEQAISVADAEELDGPDLTLVVDDPGLLVAWTQGESIVNLIRTGRAGISNLQDMETVFKLDRLPRSIRRDAEQAGDS